MLGNHSIVKVVLVALARVAMTKVHCNIMWFQELEVPNYGGLFFVARAAIIWYGIQDGEGRLAQLVRARH